jgi:hypothetical protein
MIKLKWIFDKKDLRKWAGLTLLTIRRVGGVFVQSDDGTLGFENCGEFPQSGGTVCVCCIELVT